MNEMKGKIAFKNTPLTLVGDVPEIGKRPPDVEMVNSELQKVRVADYDGKVRILSVVPSIDTPVCDMQTRKFNEEAAKLGDDVKILTISMDLPFAQKRWCAAAGINQVELLSDYQRADFGRAYGVLIKELHLLARSVFILNRKGELQYVQIVPEMTDEPNYKEVLAAAREIVQAG